MKWVAAFFILGIIAVVVAVRPSNIHAQAEPLQHARSVFEFTVHAPFRQAVALFGAHGERLWGGKDWNPQFIYPQPEEDRAGAVFTVANEHEGAPWVMSAFDTEKGHVQYVIFRSGVLITVIDIRLTVIDASNTKANVSYEWTALKPETNEHIAKMAAAHNRLGQHWEAAINGALEKAKQTK